MIIDLHNRPIAMTCRPSFRLNSKNYGSTSIMILLVILSFLVPTTTSFEFSDLNLVEKISTEVSHDWKFRCVYILKSPTYTKAERNQLLNLQLNLTKSLDKKYMPVPVLSFTFADYFHPKKKVIRSCDKALHIIMVGNGTKEEVKRVSEEFLFKNPAWVFFMNSSVRSFFEDINVNVASGIVAVDASPSKHITIYEIFKVAGKLPEDIDMASSGFYYQGQLMMVDAPKGVAYERRNDLGGVTFKAVAVENWPITSFTFGQGHRDGHIDGYFGRLWEDLEELMNFTTKIIQLNESSEGLRVIPSGLELDVDVFVAELTLTPERQKNLDYLQPLIKSNLQVYFRQHGYKIDWKVIFRPFEIDVWLAIVAWAVIVSTALFFASTTTASHGISLTDKVLFPTPLHSLFFVLQSISSQGSFRVPGSSSVRVLFFVSYALSTVVLPFYSASLISSLTKKQPLKPFDKLSEMKNTGHKLLVWHGTSDEEYFSMSSDSLLQSIYKNQIVLKENVIKDGYTALYHDMCKEERSALFAVEASMEAVIEKFYKCDVVKFTEPVSPNFEAMAVKKGSPYKEIINYNLLRLWEAGCIGRYSKKFMRREPKTSKPGTLIKVSGFDVVVTFCLLLGGMVLSLLVLALERSDGNRQTPNSARFLSESQRPHIN